MSDTTTDEFAGQGGSYMLDPVTGKRLLTERTAEPESTEPAPAAKAAEE